ncbi:hypothetical protein STAIW_v1c08770 [Spiroplasma taiwanense CT-1]|uniref:Uncharacterized protein n=1 Tax=Spiroplasma taiwanense CT-1 TaxID=1276220 RepID=S5MCL7_9MOLU|nr:hypothetical protein STAIW_v1c08770 [Spiroplasma taiwanense CT-1]
MISIRLFALEGKIYESQAAGDLFHLLKLTNKNCSQLFF